MSTKSGVEAVAIVCTNLRGAPLVPALEAELGIPIVDSVDGNNVEMPDADRCSDAGALAKWGRIFKSL